PANGEIYALKRPMKRGKLFFFFRFLSTEKRGNKIEKRGRECERKTCILGRIGSIYRRVDVCHQHGSLQQRGFWHVAHWVAMLCSQCYLSVFYHRHLDVYPPMHYHDYFDFCDPPV